MPESGGDEEFSGSLRGGAEEGWQLNFQKLLLLQVLSHQGCSLGSGLQAGLQGGISKLQEPRHPFRIQGARSHCTFSQHTPVLHMDLYSTSGFQERIFLASRPLLYHATHPHNALSGGELFPKSAYPPCKQP